MPSSPRFERHCSNFRYGSLRLAHGHTREDEGRIHVQGVAHGQKDLALHTLQRPVAHTGDRRDAAPRACSPGRGVAACLRGTSCTNPFALGEGRFDL